MVPIIQLNAQGCKNTQDPHTRIPLFGKSGTHQWSRTKKMDRVSRPLHAPCHTTVILLVSTTISCLVFLHIAIYLTEYLAARSIGKQNIALNAEQKCIADYLTNNLALARRNFIRFDQIPTHDEEECINHVTPALFDHWRRNNETICSHKDMSVQRYINRQWEGAEGYAMIHLYKNVWLRSFYSPIQNLAPKTFICQNLNETRGEFKAVATNTSCMNQPAIRVASFDPWNPYERFHVHLNVGMVMVYGYPALYSICVCRRSSMCIPKNGR
jgi:hypothetical protein